ERRGAPLKTRRAKLMQLALAAEAVAQRSDWEAAAKELRELHERFEEVESGGGEEALEKRFDDAVKKFATRREADAQAKARAAAEAAAKKARAEASRRVSAQVPVAPPPPAEPPAPPAPVEPPAAPPP